MASAHGVDQTPRSRERLTLHAEHYVARLLRDIDIA